MEEKIVCPHCGVMMRKEVISRSFGNPHAIVLDIQSFVCPKCNFRVISEDEYERIRTREKDKKTIKLLI